MNEINLKHIWAVRRHPIHKNLCISGQPEQSNTSVSANTNSRFATQNFSYILHAAFCDTLLPDNEFPRDEIATFFDISLTTIHNHFLSKGGISDCACAWAAKNAIRKMKLVRIY